MSQTTATSAPQDVVEAHMKQSAEMAGILEKITFFPGNRKDITLSVLKEGKHPSPKRGGPFWLEFMHFQAQTFKFFQKGLPVFRSLMTLSHETAKLLMT